MLKTIAHLLYPPACLLCHHRLPAAAVVGGAQAGVTNVEALFCEACERSMTPCRPPMCQGCGVEVLGAYDATAWCQRCREHPLAFEKACAPFVYVGRVREAVHAFKYHGRRRIGLWLAAQMAQTAARNLPLANIQRILPVPMPWLKQRLKGINPSEFLAQAVADILTLPCDPGSLRRTRWTSTQTRLTLRQRFRNVQGAFQARPSTSLRTILSEQGESRDRQRGGSDGTVLLIDDVLTSGATAQACTLALHEAGVSRVFVLTAASTPV